MNETRKEFMTQSEIDIQDDSVVTQYQLYRCQNGYTEFSFESGPPQTRMIDMNGRAHRVPYNFSQRLSGMPVPVESPVDRPLVPPRPIPEYPEGGGNPVIGAQQPGYNRTDKREDAV